jgi:hypothetical protein
VLVLLPVHIVAAGLGLVAGAVALSAAKGGRLHRKSGADHENSKSNSRGQRNSRQFSLTAVRHSK